jgi:hypothetical protein
MPKVTRKVIINQVRSGHSTLLRTVHHLVTLVVGLNRTELKMKLGKGLELKVVPLISQMVGDGT